jgi:kynurenine formamidase
MNEHTGTHVDATGHYMPAGHAEHKWIDQIPPERWMGRAPVIDCQGLPPRGAVTRDLVLAWEDQYGPVKRGDIVVFNYGWWKKWAIRPNDRDFLKDWPGLDPGTADLLLERGVSAIGSDTPSPEIFGVPGDQIHHKVLGRGVVIIENLSNLDQVSPLCFLMALPLPIRDGTGSPTRAIALVPRQ